MSDLPIHRFQRCRWSEARRAIDALEPGESCELPLTEYNNADTSMRRLACAYAGQRRFTMRSWPTKLVVHRIAPQ